MAKRYIRFPLSVETVKLYKDIQARMENDVEKDFEGRYKVMKPLTRVFDLVASPKYNENFIQVDKKLLHKIAIRRRKNK